MVSNLTRELQNFLKMKRGKLERISFVKLSTILSIVVDVPRFGKSISTTYKRYYNLLQTPSFTKGDEDALTFTMNFCSPILTNALTFEQQLSSRERTQALLKVAQNLFTRFDNVHVLLREIMQVTILFFCTCCLSLIVWYELWLVALI